MRIGLERGTLFGCNCRITEQLADAPASRGRGVLIAAVEPDSPADHAALQRGLVLYRLGKHDVNSSKDAERLLSRASSGTSVDLAVGIVRADGTQRRVETVTLAAR